LPALLALWPLHPGASAARPLGRCQKQGCRWLFACTSPTSITLFPPRPRPSPPPRSLMHVRPGFSPSSRRCSRPPRQLQHAATGADSSRCVATEQQSLALRRIQTDDASAGSYVAPANCRGGAKLGRESTAEPARSALASVRIVVNSPMPYLLVISADPSAGFLKSQISNLTSHRLHHPLPTVLLLRRSLYTSEIRTYLLIGTCTRRIILGILHILLPGIKATLARPATPPCTTFPPHLTI